VGVVGEVGCGGWHNFAVFISQRNVFEGVGVGCVCGGGVRCVFGGVGVVCVCGMGVRWCVVGKKRCV
jgi:hypothetical protein